MLAQAMYGWYTSERRDEEPDMIAKRINHKGQCGHAQTSNARRVCRKAMIVVAVSLVPKPTRRPP